MKKTPTLVSQKITFKDELNSPTETLDTFHSTGLQHKSKSMVNIFAGMVIVILEVNHSERKKFIDYSVGPKFDANGNIIRWTILGKPEQFSRKKVQINTPKNKDLSFDDDGPKLQSQQSGATEIRQFQQQKKAPRKKDYKVVTADALMQKMKTVQARINANAITENKLLQTLPLDERNLKTRDVRTIENFEDQQMDWELCNNQVAAKCERKPTSTIMSRSEQFRKKLQKIQVLESVKSDEQKFNDRLWYMRLRSYDNISTKQRPVTHQKFQTKQIDRFIKDPEAEKLYQKEQYILSDIYSNFGTKIIDNPHQQVEMIAKSPNEAQDLYSKGFLTLFSVKGTYKYPKKYVNGCEFLTVQGENQFKRELTLINKQEFNMEEVQGDVSEIYAQHVDISSLIKTHDYFYKQ